MFFEDAATLVVEDSVVHGDGLGWLGAGEDREKKSAEVNQTKSWDEDIKVTEAVIESWDSVEDDISLLRSLTDASGNLLSSDQILLDFFGINTDSQNMPDVQEVQANKQGVSDQNHSLSKEE